MSLGKSFSAVASTGWSSWKCSSGTVSSLTILTVVCVGFLGLRVGGWVRDWWVAIDGRVGREMSW